MPTPDPKIPATALTAYDLDPVGTVGSGPVAPARLGTGTPSAGTYLRGDGTWQTPPAAPVQSVAGRTGAVALATTDVSGLGTAATHAASDFDSAGAASTVNTALASHAANHGNPHAVTAAQVGAVARVNLATKATAGDGTAASPYTGIGTYLTALLAAASHTNADGTPTLNLTLVLDAGTDGTRGNYATDDWPNMAASGLTLEGDGPASVLHYGGTGQGLYLDGAAAGSDPSASAVNRVRLRRFAVVAPTSDNAVLLRNCHRSHVEDVEIWAGANGGLSIQGGVSTGATRVIVCPPPGGWVGGARPATGIILDSYGPYSTTAGALIECVAQGVSGKGLWVRTASAYTIFSGTYENNGTGIQVESPCFAVRLAGEINVEGNSAADVVSAASQLTFDGGFSPGYTHVTGGTGVRLLGGKYSKLIIDSGAADVLLIGAGLYWAGDSSQTPGFSDASGARLIACYRADTGAKIADVPAPYPRRATFDHRESTVLAGAALQLVYRTDVWDSFMCYQSGAQNESFTQSFLLAAGTYTLSVIGATDANRGQVDWYIDGVKVVTAQDWYSAGFNGSPPPKTASVTVVGDGYHVLKGVAAGKNAGSGGYYLSLTKFWLAPAAD